MQDEENKAQDTPKPPPTAMPQAVSRPADKQTDKHNKTRRKNLRDIPVEIVQTKHRNPANPYSYLTPKERAERLAKLWHEMFQRLDSANTANNKHESP